MNNTTKLQIDVRTGALSRLFRTHLSRADLPLSADALVGFLTTDGRWDTGMSKLIMTSSVGSSGRILSYGKSSEGGYASRFHEYIGKMPHSEILAHKGRAIYVKGGSHDVPTYGYAFRDVVWGLVDEPTDLRSALAKALTLCSTEPSQSDAPVQVVLPLYGTIGTMNISSIFNEDDRLYLARILVYEQVQGMRLAVRSLERPVHLTVVIPSEAINWASLLKQAAKQSHLEDSATLIFGTPL